MKQNGTRPEILKRLFQALKLAESALRHARHCRLTNKKTEIEESA
jgi:hypothetical protein